MTGDGAIIIPRADPLSGVPDVEAALASALRWLGPPWPGHDVDGRPILETFGDIAGSLAVALDEDGLALWASRVRSFTGSGEPGESNPDRLAMALFRETGLRVAESAAHPQLFDLVDELWSMALDMPGDVWELLAARLDGAPEDHPLARRMVALIKEVAGFYSGKLARIGQADEQPPTTRTLWPGVNDLPIGNRWAYRAAMRLWPALIMRELDPVPAAVAHGVILAAAPFDLPTIGRLLADAGPAFDAEGVAQAAPAVHGLLAEMAPALQSLRDEEGIEATRASLNGLLATLGAREDWLWLGRAWLQWIIWRDWARRPTPDPAGEATRLAVRDLLLTELAASLSAIDPPAWPWIEREEPLWRVHRVLAEAAIETANGRPERGARMLADGILRGAVTTTGRDGGLASRSLEATIVGTTLHAVADPAGWFTQLWRDSYETRERLSVTRASAHENPADPALAWGLSTLNVVAGRPGQAASLWTPLSEALRERIVTDPHGDIPNDARDMMIAVAVQLGTHFQVAGLLPLDEVAPLLTLLVGPSARFAFLADVALQAGGEPTLLALADDQGSAHLAEALEYGLASLPDPRGDILTTGARGRLGLFVALLHSRAA